MGTVDDNGTKDSNGGNSCKSGRNMNILVFYSGCYVDPQMDVNSVSLNRNTQQYSKHCCPFRKLPTWHPGSQPYKKSDGPPMTGQTTYKTDFEPPPEDLFPPKSKQIKDNLTVQKGCMEKVTSSMRDYRRFDCPVVTKSCKPDTQYKKPEVGFHS